MKTLKESILDSDVNIEDDIMFTDALSLRKLLKPCKWKKVSGSSNPKIKTTKKIWYNVYQEFINNITKSGSKDINIVVRDSKQEYGYPRAIICMNGDDACVIENAGWDGVSISLMDAKDAPVSKNSSTPNCRWFKGSQDIIDYIKWLVNQVL